MTRRLRIKCPACQAVLEVPDSAQPQVEVTCPKCGKRIAAKVLDVASKPVPASATPGSSIGSTPVRSAPARSAPVRSAPVRSAPVQAAPVAASDDLWSAPLGLPAAPLDLQGPLAMAAPAANYPGYHPGRRAKINHKLWLWPLGIVLGLCIAIPIFWYGSGLVAKLASGDWSSMTMFPDSHQQLTNDFLIASERSFTFTATVDPSQPGFRDLATAHIKRERRTYEQLLLRAVRLPKGSLTERAAFQEKAKAQFQGIRDKAIENAKAKAANPGAGTPIPPEIQKELQGPELADSMMLFGAVGVTVMHAIWDLPAPQNDVEQIYYDEADLVREYLKGLANIHSKSQCSRAHTAIEAQADRMLEIAIRRSKLPRNFLERVPREYVDIDRAMEAAENGLVRRIERDLELTEELKDAIASFAFARECLSRASTGTSEPVLQKSFAGARERRAKTISRSSSGPESSQDRELVVKPRFEAKEEEEPATASATAAPATTSSATTTPTKTAPAAGDRPQGSAEPDQATLAGPGAPPPGSPHANAPFSGQSAVGASETDSAMPEPPFGRRRTSPLGPPSSGSERNRRRFGGGASGPPADFGRGGGPPSGENSFESQLARFNGPDAVIINFSRATFDVGAAVKRFSAELSVKEYLTQSSGGKGVIALRYSGPLEQVTSLIDFGQIASVDHATRVIEVVGAPEQ